MSRPGRILISMLVMVACLPGREQPPPSGEDGSSQVMTRLTTSSTSLPSTTFPPSTTSAIPAPGLEIGGQPKRWHTVTLTFEGPPADEEGQVNPFLDYRLEVELESPNGQRHLVPGFFAADGSAAHTAATSGRKWRAHFVPDEPGTWSFRAELRAGDSIAVRDDVGERVPLTGGSAEFDVAESDEEAQDSRARGMLRYVGDHYLEFAGTAEPFIKTGTNSPENLLGYEDFDGTSDTNGDFLHTYAPHLPDWNPGDPEWGDERGRGLIGALNYLSRSGVNSAYFLTYNLDRGDGGDVWPWTNPEERERFDVSKLDQWELVFSHMDKLGMQLHLVLQETENDHALDDGDLGPRRRLYYRELVARFAHHLALVWNLGEENTNSTDQRKAHAGYLRDLDPYDHPITVHSFNNRQAQSEVYRPLLGFHALEGASLHTANTHEDTLWWRRLSEEAGRPWVVTHDELWPGEFGVPPDDNQPPGYDTVRGPHLWGNLLAGGAGVEWYFGYGFAEDDLTLEDFRSRHRLWEVSEIARTFVEGLPVRDMGPADQLSPTEGAHVLALAGEIYAIYIPEGGVGELDLQDSRDSFSVDWYDPRLGGELQDGSVETVTGPGVVSLGRSPQRPGQDWVVRVTRR